MEHLTLRQREVLERVKIGQANKIIARELSIHESTVKVHIRHLMRGFKCTSRTELAYKAMNRLEHPYENWRAAIAFALEDACEGIEFLRLWNYGEWSMIDRHWPNWKPFLEKFDVGS